MPVSFCVSATIAARRSSALRNSCSILVSITGVLMRHPVSLKVVSQDARVVVLLIMRGVEQGHRSCLHKVAYSANRLLVGDKLSPVAAREVGEPSRVVAEPSPKLVAWRTILQPHCPLGLILASAA